MPALRYLEIQDNVTYTKLLSIVCEQKIEFTEEMQLNLSPCSFWRVSHDNQPGMALVHNGQVDDKLLFCEYVYDILIEKQNVLKARCVHLDENVSDNPILLFEPKQTLKDFCMSCEVITEIDQLTILRDIAVGTHGFQSYTNLRIEVTMQSIFVDKDSKGGIRALFSPMYQHSYFPHFEQCPESTADYQWVKNSLLLMHYRDRCGKHSELPKSHILYNILKYKWFSNEKSLHPKDTAEIAKEIRYILGK